LHVIGLNNKIAGLTMGW